MKTITLANQKGGVGKSTSSGALASGLSKRGYKVIAVDLDPQCNLSLGAGADILNMDKSLYDVFKETVGLQDLIQTTSHGYDLITGGLSLAGADMDFTQTGREYMLKEALDSLRNDYDFCIIDTPPTLGILTVNALTASDKVIIPLSADLYAIQGLSQLNMLIKRVTKYSNHDLKVSGLLITRHDERTNVSKALSDQINQLAEKLGTKVFRQPIRNSVAVRESQAMMSDLFTEAPKANATKDYAAFIDELLEGENEDGK